MRNIKHITRLSVFISFLIFALSGCESTRFINSWKAEQMTGVSIESITVIAMMKDVAYRRAFENSFCVSLKKEGINALSGLELFPLSRQYTQEEMEEIFKTNNITTLLIVTDAGSESSREYVPGNAYSPYSLYNNYYGYYGYYNYYNYYDPYRYRADQGYYVNTEIRKIEVAAFDLDSDKLFWSAMSQTVDPGSLVQFAGDVADSFVAKMKSDEIMK